METEQSTTEQPWVREEIRKKLKSFLNSKKIKTQHTQPMKAVLRGKFIALSVHVKKMEKAHIET